MRSFGHDAELRTRSPEGLFGLRHPTDAVRKFDESTIACLCRYIDSISEIARATQILVTPGMFAVSITWKKMGSSDALAFQVLQQYQRNAMRVHAKYEVRRGILGIDFGCF